MGKPRRVSWALAAVCACATVACGSDDAEPPAVSHSLPACSSLTWRNPTPGTVACPGAPGCACASGSVCCLPPSAKQTDVGSCTALTACTQVAFACDGPEDCASGEVCCGVGMTVECKAASACPGNALILCRAEADCASAGVHCGPGDATSFWDGLIGVCR